MPRMQVAPRRARLLAGVIAASGLLVLKPLAYAQDTPAGAEAGNAPPRLVCAQAAQPPIIDGALDDPCWQQATRVEGFYRYDKELPATEPTEAYICQDATAIYVGFRCHDTHPEQVKREQRKRGASAGCDDTVSFRLDTYHQHRDGYYFQVSARGTQYEQMPGTQVPKIEWRGDWRAAARVNADGWTVEIAVPFSILRYPNGPDTWGFLCGRYLSREDESCVWPRIGTSWNWGKCADLGGLKLPPYRESPVALPYALAESSNDEGSRTHFGLDLKYPLNSGLRLDGTYRPDFRNIEDVVETVDFSYTERSLPERRPFFLDTWEETGPPAVLYTRRVGDIRSALGLTGRAGRLAPTVLMVDTMDQGRLAATSLDYAMGACSEFCVAVADVRDGPTPDNTVGRATLQLGRYTRLGSNEVRATYYRSQTAGEGGDGFIRDLYLAQRQGQGRVSWSATFHEISPDYNAVLGYVPEKGIREVSANASSWTRRETGGVRESGWYVSLDRVRSLIGDPTYYSTTAEVWRNLRNFTSQWIGAYDGRREGFTDAGVYVGHSWGGNNLYRSGSASLDCGERLGGSSLFASICQGLKAGQNLALEVSAEYLRMTAPSTPLNRRQFVLTGTYDISDERTISGRLVESPDGFNAYFTYRQVVRRGMDAYVIIGDPNADDFTRRIAVKAVWAVFP